MYSVTYSCSNCGHSFSKEFKKGMPAPSTIICDKCSCGTASKDIWPKPKTLIDYGDFFKPKPIKPLPPSPPWTIGTLRCCWDDIPFKRFNKVYWTHTLIA